MEWLGQEEEKEKSLNPSLPSRPSKFQRHGKRKGGKGGEGAEIVPATPPPAAGRERPGAGEQLLNDSPGASK